MSFHVASICTDHKFGSSPRKQVITFLADKASDDGSGVWCSKGTVARCTELSKSTVKRVFQQFLNEGILVETGKRFSEHGFTVAYCINLDKVLELPLTKRDPETREVTVTPVQGEPPKGATVNPQGGSPRTPNHPLTIPKLCQKLLCYCRSILMHFVQQHAKRPCMPPFQNSFDCHTCQVDCVNLSFIRGERNHIIRLRIMG